LFVSLSNVIEVRELYASIIVSDRIGFDLNSTALTFGEATLGGGSSRSISLKNNFGFPIEVEIYGEGDIKKFITPIKERMEKGENKSIGISALVPEDADFGKYEGRIKIIFRKIND
jgi:hypothetical protein